MRRRQFIAAAVSFALGSRVATALGQNAKPSPVVGTWALVSIYEEDGQGEEIDRWGDDPQGRFIADDVGNFMFQLVGRDVIKLGSAAPPAACREFKNNEGIAYSGQYALDAERRTIALLAKDALSRKFDRKRLTASISFEGDELGFIAAGEGSPTGAFYVHLRWQRVRA